MDDWQDAAFSSRHMHNRVGRSGGRGSGKSKRNSAFDVHKTFGTYSCKCPAWHRLSSASDHADQKVTLELYRLTEDGLGVVGEILLPGVLQAAVILAASRDSMKRILSELEPAEPQGDGENTNDEDDEEGSGTPEDDEEEDKSDRFNTFEKNSFRAPKFWLQWNGTLFPTQSRSDPKHESGLGYIVFGGNDCRKFKGTLNCISLGWKDVAISGHSVAKRSESDVPVAWGQGTTT